MVRAPQRIALLRDGEGHHLQGGRLHDLPDLLAVVEHGQAVRHGSHDLLIQLAVRVQGDGDGQVIVGAEALRDDLLIVALAADDPCLHLAFLDQPLAQHRREDPKDVPGAEMQPLGILCRIFRDLLRIVAWKVIALPVLFILDRCQ